MSWATRLLVSAVVVTSLVLVVHAASPGRSSASSSAPVGLTSQGRVLWNFEGLLRKTFGHRQPLCVSGNLRLRTFWNFTAGECSPLAKYLLYWYTFRSPGGTVFHIVGGRERPPNFGNYPVAVLIRGHMIACDGSRRRYLVDYASDAGLALGCLPPQSK